MTIHWKNLDTAGKIEAIRSAWRPGRSMEQIGARLGVTRNAVRSVYKRFRGQLSDCPLNPQRARPGFQWSDEEKRKLAGYLRQGLSARQIAPLMEKSRSAVIGVVQRDKELNAIGFQNKRCVKGQPSTWMNPRPRPVKTAIARLPPKPKPAIVCAEVEPPLNLTLMDLESHHCRWPVTDDGPHRFCGHAKQDGVSYCAGHYAMSVGPGTRSEREASMPLSRAA